MAVVRHLSAIGLLFSGCRGSPCAACSDPIVMQEMTDSVQPSSPLRGVQRSSPVLLFLSRRSPDGKFSMNRFFHLLHTCFGANPHVIEVEAS